jgi:hypothetical protein
VESKRVVAEADSKLRQNSSNRRRSGISERAGGKRGATKVEENLESGSDV